ncbi:MAG: hypothetical protein DSY47_03305 [Hydrogenothermus sp.]|nr:MAG: hypothetical protein DSY47_03305 [Hydrogenothermus sp.]
MKNKKIFLYTPSLQPGGVFNSNKLLAEGFAKKGYKVKIITNRKTNLEIEGFEHIHLNAGDFVRPFKLKKIILEEKPLAIFSSMQTQNISLALAKMLINNTNIETKFFGFIRTTDAGIKYKSIVHIPFKKLVKFLYKKLDKIITVSSTAKKDIINTFGLKEELINIIPNPVDLKLIDSLKIQSLKEEEEKIFKSKTIIFVGRFAKVKNIDMIIEVFKKLKIYFSNLNLVLVGDGEEKENIIKISRNIDNIYILNFTPNPTKYISKSSVFVFTSRDEGFPRVVVESFACGTPVVAFKNEFSGHVDIIDDGKNGFLVPFGDIDQFVEKVKILLENEDLRKKFSKNAIEKAKEFELDKIISKLEELIYS